MGFHQQWKWDRYTGWGNIVTVSYRPYCCSSPTLCITSVYIFAIVKLMTLFLSILDILTSEAIQCYRCVFASYVYFLNNTFLCKDFDYSNRFIVDCPYSTLCMKKNTYATINGGNFQLFSPLVCINATFSSANQRNWTRLRFSETRHANFS